MSPKYTDTPELLKAAFNMASIRRLGRAAFNKAAPLAREAGQRGLSAGGLGSAGALVGSGVGGAVGAARGYQEDGLSGALKSGLKGAAGGAAVGGAAGGLGGALGGKRARELARSMSSRKDLFGKASRFGERQVHSVTGALPAGMTKREGLKSIGASPVQNLKETIRSAADPSKRRALRKAVMPAERLEQAGATNVPGLFRALAKNPKGTVKDLAKHEWYSTPSLGGKALAFGLPAGYVASQAAQKPQEGESRLGNTLGALGESAAFAAPLALTGATALSGAASAAGNRLGDLFTGKGLRKKRLGENPGPPIVEESAEAQPAEHSFSDRASGNVQL